MAHGLVEWVAHGRAIDARVPVERFVRMRIMALDAGAFA
jgi:hypothetical protein